MLLVKTKLGPSPIAGVGLFADEVIPKGTPVWRHLDGFDLCVAPSVVERLSGPAREQLQKYGYLDEETGSYDLCADDARFFNHADSPNTVSVSGEDGEEVYVAAADIAAGAEITCDYRTYDLDWRRKLGRQR